MEGKKKVRGEGAKWGEGSRKQRIKGRKEKFRPTSTQITFLHLGYRQNW